MLLAEFPDLILKTSADAFPVRPSGCRPFLLVRLVDITVAETQCRILTGFLYARIAFCVLSYSANSVLSNDPPGGDALSFRVDMPLFSCYNTAEYKY